ncbi:MAG: hypothetical protein K0R76_349 [Alphaproteobacteria bacterium]|jgi:uncharacterized integral membrane protein (TIGR00697 family)|nr:hypothetical protein [Alphaproteobacteria bacterium]MDF3033395.1 hypothetical protein [Alphaproteobacteria bacterium]
MSTSDKIYTTLCVLFSVLIVIGNLIYQKFVSLPLFSFHTFELSVGAMVYPLTFQLTDLITEFYGKEKANFCVRLGVSMSLFVAFIIAGMDQLEATSWSKITNDTFHNVFGSYNVAFIGSMIACYVSQAFDIFIYLGIRKWTGSKWLWLRNNGSTAISLLIDTSVVICIMTLFGVLPMERMGTLIANSYLFKLFFTVCSTPLFYTGFWIIRRLLATPSLQPFRRGSNDDNRQDAAA